MKKLYASLTAVVLLFSIQMFAQTNAGKHPLKFSKTPRSLQLNPVPVNTPGGKHNGFVTDRCGFVTQQNKAKRAGYDAASFEAIVNRKVQEIQAARAAGRGTAAVNYTIPVVFHVINDGSAEGTSDNLAASQVYAQIDQLNKDFGNLSGSPFPAAAASGITFCAVVVDPSGTVLAQPGIDRVNWVTKGWEDPTDFVDQTDAGIEAMIDYIDGTIKPASIWDPTRYVNIWAYNFENSGLLGYATFPTSGATGLPAGETATTAGAVFLSGSLGSVASPGTIGAYGLGRTITHELGHFFGLFHIWGDVTGCGGTDYCADTPPCSSAYFSEVPNCIAPTQCSGTRMIQNYMDYSDDGCMNTYTQNQVDRMQAVMAVAARRPANSTLCTPPVANAIAFTTISNSVAETGVGAACPKFKDYLITVKPAVAASGNATINFSISGTATLNSDYQVVGATSVSYTNGESAAKGFTIRIIDDGGFEAAETIILNYTITGTGVVAGTSNQSNTITILDDDFFGNVSATPLTILMQENFGTTAAGGAVPAGWITGSFAAGGNKFTVNPQYGAATGFNASNGRVLHITGAGNTAINNETAPATYTVGTVSTPVAASDVIAITKAINTTGYKNIKLTFDYACNGEADVDDIYDLGLLTYSIGNQTMGITNVTDFNDDIVYFQGKTAKTTVSITLPAAVANQSSVYLGWEWINDENTGSQPPFIIDNVVVTGEVLGVETVASQTATITQNSGHTAQYVSATGNIIAAIANLNQNVGCITASVNQSGTSTLVNLTTPSGNYQRSSKVVWIQPATANTTATYQATFYYTTAEVANWPNPLLLKIMKVKDGVDVFGTVTPSDAVLFTPTVDDQRAGKGYISYTINATGGFSQFLLVSQLTVLPVQSLNFVVKANEKNIGLTWSTTSELNNKGFAIERSADGTTFEKIGWVDGAVNSSRAVSYSYADNFVQPEVLYYYRLRQTDLDGRSVLSEVRQAKIKGAGLSITISPNPAKDFVKIFAAGTSGLSDIRLYNAEGQLARTWNRQNLSVVTMLDISGLAKGMYLLNIQTAGKTKVEKLIIQ